VEKCAKYWDAKNMRYFDVKIVKEEHLDKGIDLRIFQLINIYNKNTIKYIHQIHLTCWEDHTALGADYFDKIIKIIVYLFLFTKIIFWRLLLFSKDILLKLDLNFIIVCIRIKNNFFENFF
jgi:hypothetical protein